MKIRNISPDLDYTLLTIFEDGTQGYFDVKPYLQYEAFEPLKHIDEFKKVCNKFYYIEWECGADLSADTIEARLKLIKP